MPPIRETAFPSKRGDFRAPSVISVEGSECRLVRPAQAGALVLFLAISALCLLLKNLYIFLPVSCFKNQIPHAISLDLSRTNYFIAFCNTLIPGSARPLWGSSSIFACFFIVAPFYGCRGFPSIPKSLGLPVREGCSLGVRDPS